MGMSPDQIKLLEKEIALREEALKLKENLPHLYGMKYYRWQRKFLISKRKYNTLVANNQSGKSSINIIKCITWATETSLWPRLWKKTPTQFWYLYPDGGTATAEFENKWVKEFLPQGEMKNHPVYGWKAKYRNGDIDYLRFNTGITIYFKTYGQDVHSLQAGSCFAIFCDEELPWPLMSELQMRVSATDGYMHFVFTATRGQEEWRLIVEERGKMEMWKESEVDILKLQVSAYDCLYYEDGTPSTVWSVEKIEEAKKFLHSDAQIQRRIYGKFVKDEGLKYPSFNRQNNTCEPKSIDLNTGHLFAALDYGSGTNHQSSVGLLWVNKECTYGVVFDIWVGAKGIPTDAGMVVRKYMDMVKSHGLKYSQVLAFYDWSCRDLKTIGNSLGLYLEAADKSHATGERILNTLFKNCQLDLMQVGDWEIAAKQIESLTLDENKKYAWDDAADVVRYLVTKVPWNYVNLQDKKPSIPTSKNPRRRHAPVKPQEETYEDEINEWAEYFEFQDYDSF